MEEAQSPAAGKVRKPRATKPAAGAGTIIDGVVTEVADNPEAKELQKIVTIDKATEVAKFNPIRAKAAELVKEIESTVYDITTADGEDTARALRRRCVGMRTSAVKVYEAWNRPVLDAQREMRAIVDDIKTLVTPAETALDAAITKKEQEREAEKQRKIAEEQARIAALRAKITAIAALPTAAAKATRSDDIRVLVATMDTITVDEATYGEFLEEAIALHTDVRAQLDEMIQAAVTREEQAARQAEEAQRLAREREALTKAAALRTKISAIQAIPLQAFGKTSADIEKLSANMVAPMAEEFGDLLAEAQAAHDTAQTQLAAVLVGARATEASAEAARLARLDAERLQREADEREQARQTEATAQAQLLRNQQDAFEFETAQARARLQEETDRLAADRKKLEDHEASLTAPPAAADGAGAPTATGADDESTMPAGPSGDQALDLALQSTGPQVVENLANDLIQADASSAAGSVPDIRPSDLGIARAVSEVFGASVDTAIDWLATFNRDDCLVALDMEEIPA